MRNNETVLPAERALIWSCIAFSLLAIAMIILPYVIVGFYISDAENPDAAVRLKVLFWMTYGAWLLILSAFFWTSSLVMSVVAAVFARHIFKSKHGIFLIISNLVVIFYGVYYLKGFVHG